MSRAWPGSTRATVSERRARRYLRILGSAANSASWAGSATSRTAALRCNSGPSGCSNGKRESKISFVTVMRTRFSQQEWKNTGSFIYLLVCRERKLRTTLLGQLPFGAFARYREFHTDSPARKEIV